MPQTPQAAMRMSAALGGTSGFGTSRITGGSPGPSKVATRMFGMGPPNGKRKGASTVLPLAATAIRRKIHIGNNPVKWSGSVLCVLPGDDETRVVCFEHLVQRSGHIRTLGAFGDPLSL